MLRILIHINRDNRKNVNYFGVALWILDFIMATCRACTFAMQIRSNFLKIARWRAPASRKDDEHRRCRPRKPGKSVMQESLMTTNGAPCMQVNAQGPTSRRTSVEASSDLGDGNSWFHCGNTHAEMRYREKNRGCTIRKRRRRRRPDRYRYSIKFINR